MEEVQTFFIFYFISRIDPGEITFETLIHEGTCSHPLHGLKDKGSLNPINFFAPILILCVWCYLL